MDPSSFANISEALITHVELELTCNFEQKIIYGRSTYTYQSLTKRVLILDTNHLEILTCSSPFSLSSEHPVYGKALHISLDSETGTFTITYKTTPFATAVQFLSPSQTAGKVHSFCYTQCQAIHCRSLFPVQDTPQGKFTINYHISAPEGLKAVAGGLFVNTTESIPGFKVFHFSQPIPISSYLVAFAIGNIDSVLIGPKSTLYSEPEVLNSAAEEFSLINSMLEAAESIMTPYFWGKLDLLVLPPSFPFGGMENPNLIYVTPTILAGDKSLTNLVAHEIAHSWTGNTVTNSTWEHFWLNEGFTVYFERKITKKLLGAEEAELELENGLKNLEKTVNLFGNEHNFTRLYYDIDGIDPDDAFSVIPYEKGCVFLLYLESLVGEEAFLQFLREYVSDFKGKNIDSAGFKDYFLSKFGLEVDWNTWLRGTGMPPWLPSINNSALNIVLQLFQRLESDQPLVSDIQSLTVSQKVVLLNHLLTKPTPRTIEICEVYNFHTNNNSEIKFLWLTLVIKTKTEKYYPQVSSFLKSQGRMKYVRPLFRELYANGLNDIAFEIFESSKNFYHSTLVSLLSKEFSLG